MNRLSRTARALLPFLLLLPATALVGCGGSSPPPASAPEPGYLALQETFGPRDFGPLGGRRIVLDPGHGGYFRGALGPAGLAEADVNLGVALNLRGLLEWAGAEVFMTRTADYDFLSPADSSLAGDLASRVAFTDSIQPDVFLSIHHNSTAARDPDINETQTYYPLGDDGAAVDLARAIHRHLVLNLEIAPAKILPGNFHVLRNATVPAVLGEPAMISNPVMEGRLSQAASQRLEAEAYFLGLLDYFAGGDPRWLAAQGDTVVVGARDTMLSWTFGDSHPEAPGPDPDTFELRVDGHRVRHGLSRDGRTVTWTLPADPTAGPRRLVVRGRNLAGRRTPPAATAAVPAAGGVILVHATSEAAGTPDRRAHLRCRTPDGRPLPAGRLVWGQGGGLRSARLGGVPELGRLLLWSGTTPMFTPESAGIEVRFTETVLAPGRWLRGVGGQGRWRDRPASGEAAGPALLGAVVRDADRVSWSEAPGWIPVVSEARPRGPQPDIALALEVAPALLGRTVVIDPAGGGTDTDGAGPLGLRGADLNLEVARQLARLVTGCGGRAVLTRHEGGAPAPPAKVALADRVGADFFLTVGRAADDTVRIRHHHGSPAGSRWARATTRAVGFLLPAAARDTGPSWSYLLRHTACPALEVRLPGPRDAAAEMRLDTVAWQNAEARALLLALAGMVDPDGGELGLVVPPRDLADVAGLPPWPEVVHARWDGNLPWYPLPGPDGQAGTASVASWADPGLPRHGREHTLELRTRAGWQFWILTRETAGSWHGRLMASGTGETTASP